METKYSFTILKRFCSYCKFECAESRWQTHIESLAHKKKAYEARMDVMSGEKVIPPSIATSDIPNEIERALDGKIKNEKKFYF